MRTPGQRMDGRFEHAVADLSKISLKRRDAAVSPEETLFSEAISA